MNFNPGCTQRTHGGPRAGSGLSPSQGPGSGAGALGCAVGSPGPPALLPRTPHISRIPPFSPGRILLWGYSPKPNSFLDAWIFFPFPLPLSFFIFKPKRKPTQNENCEPTFLERKIAGGVLRLPLRGEASILPGMLPGHGTTLPSPGHTTKYWGRGSTSPSPCCYLSLQNASQAVR